MRLKSLYEEWLYNITSRTEQIPFIVYLIRLFRKAEGDNIGLLAAGMSFYFLMAAFPAIAALISLYGLFSDPYQITDQLELFSAVLPSDAYRILLSQAEKVAASHNSILSLSLIISLLIALFGASRGIRALIKGLNIVYNIQTKRSLIKLNMTIFFLTFALLFYFMMALVLLAAIPLAVNFFFPYSEELKILVHLRWLVMLLFFIMGLDILYYLGPEHPAPQWKWFSPGAIVATFLWIGCSFALSIFVTYIANYNETYGSLGTVIALMVWFWLSALAILAGAEINALRRIKKTNAPRAHSR